MITGVAPHIVRMGLRYCGLIFGGAAIMLCTCTNIFNKLVPKNQTPIESSISDNRTIPLYDVLPPPLSSSLSSNVETRASDLASEVMTGDTQNVVPALERALLEGGVGIRDSRSNTILYKDQIKGTMGFCLNDWEVICLGRTTVSDMRMTMGDLAKVIGFPDIGLDSAKALDLLYDGINMSLTNTADTALRFRASFIDALSSNGFPFTGLSGIVNGNAPVSQLQASMMILQYASDLAGFLKSHPAGAPKKLVTGSRSGTTTDCNFDEASSTVMDWSAFGITYGYGKLLGYLEDAGMSAAGKYAQVSGAVSAALALIKFIASGAALETTLDVEGGEPLMRTTTRQPGERKVLKATAKFNIGSWSYLNCARIAFNAANTDFNLPNDGPLDGVKVAWSLNIGSTDFGTNVIQNSIVQF